MAKEGQSPLSQEEPPEHDSVTQLLVHHNGPSTDHANPVVTVSFLSPISLSLLPYLFEWRISRPSNLLSRPLTEI